MSNQSDFDKASDDLADARLEFAIAESNLAAARAELTRAERKANAIWQLLVNRCPQVTEEAK